MYVCVCCLCAQYREAGVLLHRGFTMTLWHVVVAVAVLFFCDYCYYYYYYIHLISVLVDEKNLILENHFVQYLLLV